MAGFADGKIEAFVGPTELGAADDLERVIVDFIGGAERSLDIAVQELDNEAIAQAILDARFRGVTVRMVMEQGYLLTGKVPAIRRRAGEDEAAARRRAQWENQTGANSLEENRRLLSALLRCNVDVKADYNPAIFHQKFIIRDYRGDAKPTSAILSGSANFTVTDCHRNLNHIVVFHDWRICREYASEFASIRGRPVRPGRARRGAAGVQPRGRAGEGPLRAGPHARAGDHEADAEVDRARRLRHLHLLRLVRHRRRDDHAGGGRPADPGRRRSRPGRPGVGGHPRPAPRRHRALPPRTGRRRSASCTTSSW